MVSNKRISLDPIAPDNLYTGAQKVNAALDEMSTETENLKRNVGEVTQQLAETGKHLNISNDFIRLGRIKLPDDFPEHVKLPFSLHRDSDKVVKHDFNFDKLELNAGHIYVAGYAG